MHGKTRIAWLVGVLLLGFFILGERGLARADTGPRQYLPVLAYQRPHPTLHDLPTARRYIVREGDTLLSLAYRFQRPLDVMACALPAGRDAREPLHPGEVVFIPPRESVCHVVGRGQTLGLIARAYGVGIGDIVAQPQNGFTAAPYEVVPGQRVLVPLARGVTVEPWSYGDGQFTWPVHGVISQGWKPEHPALDLAADAGTIVVAADTGVVEQAGWNTQGYGWLVIIDHRNGYRTYYAHLKSIWIGTGDRVVEGQPIGLVGSTGNSTGPHVHFEVRDYGVRVDPRGVLPVAGR